MNSIVVPSYLLPLSCAPTCCHGHALVLVAIVLLLLLSNALFNGLACLHIVPHACQAEPPEEWEPRFGWTDFNPHATLVLHAGATTNLSPLRLTAHQMRTMTHSQFAQLVMCEHAQLTPSARASMKDVSFPLLLSVAPALASIGIQQPC